MFIIPLSLLDFGGLSTNLVKSLDESTRAKTTLAMSRKTYFLTEMRVIVTYLRLLIFPVNQTLDYDYPMNKVFFQLPVSASFAILCGLAALGVVFFRRSKAGRPEQRVLSFGICWFFITLSVESTFVPLFVIFEHRLYLPSAGVITGLAFGTFMILDAVRNRRAKAALVIFMVAWPLVLGCAAFSRNRTWNGEISIWEDVIAKAPNKARGYASLGRAYQEIGENSRAQELYQEALDLQKRSGSSLAGEKKENEVLSVTYLYIGNNYYAQGDAALAMQNYEQAISADKNNAIAYYNLGIVYLNDGLTGKAIEQVETSIAINPGFAQAHFIKGEALLEDSRIDEAIDSYRRAVSLDPELGQAWQGMARAFGRKKDFDQATRYYRKASELMPDVSDVQYQFGNALKEAGNMKAAQAAWKRTVELDPKNSGALNQLGVYYLTEGDEERAVKYLERSLKYRELNAEAHYNLAVALERLGRLEEAVAHYERFIQVASPGYADVVILAQERVRQLGGTSPSDN
jgi:tetratricopeptide (TPR) repeat protein